MNVLVTGGAGYIGSHTSKSLKKAGHQPVVLDNCSYGHEWACKWGPLEKGDLEDVSFINSVLNKYSIEAVVHFAASTYVGESICQPLRYFKNNYCNTINLLEAMVKNEVRKIVFSSTCATYGDPQTEQLTEEHQQVPVSPYGESKLFVERTLRWTQKAFGIRYVCLRYFNASGADPLGEIGEDHTPETHLMPLAIEAAIGKRENIRVYGTDYDTPDGTAIRDYIHVEDIANAHVAAVNHLYFGGDSLSLNVGTGIGSSVLEVIKSVEQVSKREIAIVRAPRREGDSPRLVADASKIRKILRWIPQYTELNVIAQHAWQWYAKSKT